MPVWTFDWYQRHYSHLRTPTLITTNPISPGSYQSSHTNPHKVGTGSHRASRTKLNTKSATGSHRASRTHSTQSRHWISPGVAHSLNTKSALDLTRRRALNPTQSRHWISPGVAQLNTKSTLDLTGRRALTQHKVDTGSHRASRTKPNTKSALDLTGRRALTQHKVGTGSHRASRTNPTQSRHWISPGVAH